MKILKVDMEKIPKFIINVVKQLIKLGDSNGKYNNREYNCAHCFNINGIVWYAKAKEKKLYFQTVQIGMSVVSNIILSGITGAIINAQV